MSLSDQCILCARARGAGTCAAFPDGIPEDIITGRFDHRRAHEGDRGLRFKPRTGDAAKDTEAAFPSKLPDR